MKTKFSGILTLLLAFVVQLTFAQEKTISGTVSDISGLPLPGVNILVKGTTSGTQTDFDGKYSLNAKSGDVLTFSYIGLKTKEATVGASNTVNVTMEEDAAVLDEVVVTALGIKRKQDEITTSNQVVKTEELTRANNPSVLQGLSGKVTGLQVTQASNGISGESRIVLRGNRSITGDNQALIVIDGAISTASFLSNIDPNTIESINVIKGANGAALYGQQGSNGVMIVTTKRGTANEKMKLTFKTSSDFTTVAYVPEQQTRYGQGWDYGNGGYENVLYENGAWGPEFDGQMTAVGLPQADGSYIMAPYSSRGADHVKEFFDTGHTYQNSISLSSGNADSYIFLSANNENTEFVIKNDRLNRSAFNFKAGQTLGKWRVAGNATYSYTGTKEAFSRDFNNSIYRQLLQVQSNIPIREFEFSGNEGSPNAYYANPYYVRDNNRRERDFNRFNILGEVEYTFNENITVLIRSNGLFTFGNTLVSENAYVETAFISGLGGDRSQASFFREDNSAFSQYYTDALLNFDYKLSDDFTFKANVGVNNQYIKNSRINVAGEQLTVPELNNTGNLAAGFDNNNTRNFRTAEKSYAVFANVDFGFRDFLFFNATGRNDWTSTLSKENNNFFYPSVGLAFIPTKAFDGLKGDVINYVKLSGNYVRVGSKSQVGPYGIQETFSQAPGFPFNGQNSFAAPTFITDPNIEPEFTTSLDFGLNLGLLNDRITIDAAYYNFNTDNQITTVSASLASGLNQAQVNLSETKGWGVEFDLGLVPIKTEDFRWDVHFGFTKNYTEVVKVSDESNEVALGGLSTIQSYAVAGEQFPIIRGTDYERDDQGRVIIGANGNPTQATGLVNLGKVTPDYILNATTAFTYKGFTLAATMDYRTGKDYKFYSMAYNGMLFSGQTVESAQNGRGGFIYPNSVINTGTAAAPVYVPNTSVPTGSTTGSFINFYGDRSSIASASVFDATAFKVRELSLSYDVNPKYLERTAINKLSISVIGRNLITVLAAGNRGYNDPETNFTTNGNGAGIAYFDQYPPVKTYGFGVTLTF